jgi:hypothetical protein
VITPAPSKLVIHTAPSTTATAGQPLAVQPVIYEEDQSGNLITADNNTVVTASLASGAGPLQGTVSVTVVGGVATFTNLADNLAETFSLKFAAAGLQAGPTANIVVSPAAPFSLTIHTQPPGTATAGQAFTTQPVVYEEDRFGNLEVNDNTTMTSASIANGTGPLKGSTVVAITGGIATFTDLSANTAHSIALRFTGGGLTSPTSVPVLISPAAPTKLVISTEPSATAQAGQPFSTQPVISEEDQYGNIETGDNSMVVTASLASGAGPLQGARAIAVSKGVATFVNLGDSIGESITLKFTAGSLSSATSSAIQVIPVQSPSPTPTILGASIAMTTPTKKKKATFSGFKIQYSIPMNPTSATFRTNYLLLATIKGSKTKPVSFTASYDPSSNSVTLKVGGKNPFAKGGQLTILSSPPNGVRSQAGVFLNTSSLAFRISANAKSITRG